MNDATKNLLLKLRKGADASFGVSHWEAVLVEMGFQFGRVTEARKVTRVDITAPNGACLSIDKEPRYKHVVFYNLRSWAKKQGYSLPDMAAKALGMPTVAEEAAEKDYYKRDWTNTGTCGCCEGNFKREASGGLVHHGYQRPGDGAILGDCFGVGYQPHEISPDCAKDYLEQALRPFLARAQETLRALRAGEVVQICTRKADPRSGRKAEYVHPGEFGWERELMSMISAAEYRVGNLERDVKHFEAKVAGWKADDLPEAKLAKKYGNKDAAKLLGG